MGLFAASEGDGVVAVINRTVLSAIVKNFMLFVRLLFFGREGDF